jgi:hypothetical protein
VIMNNVRFDLADELSKESQESLIEQFTEPHFRRIVHYDSVDRASLIRRLDHGVLWGTRIDDKMEK